jgi:hypothetical protein
MTFVESNMDFSGGIDMLDYFVGCEFAISLANRSGQSMSLKYVGFDFFYSLYFAINAELNVEPATARSG